MNIMFIILSLSLQYTNCIMQPASIWNFSATELFNKKSVKSHSISAKRGESQFKISVQKQKKKRL